MVSNAIVLEKVLAIGVETDDGHQVELHRGMTVEIRDFKENYSTIMIIDYYQKNFAYENNLYLCKSSALFRVPQAIWPFLIAINDPIERTNIAKDKSLVDYILRLELNSFVTVNGQYFSLPTNRDSALRQSLSFLPEREPKDRSLDYDCVIRYIGPVEEIGSPGYLFGLELLVNFTVAQVSSFHTPNDNFIVRSSNSNQPT